MDAITETGLITIIGIMVAFLLRCCGQIEESRCSTIKCFGVECDRNVYSEKHIEMMNKERKANEEKKEEEDTDNNV
tara:strand:- start:1132 stop:1359 length:228 start_codon:yes stop_codon:yes gene_type:complete